MIISYSNLLFAAQLVFLYGLSLTTLIQAKVCQLHLSFQVIQLAKGLFVVSRSLYQIVVLQIYLQQYSFVFLYGVNLCYLRLLVFNCSQKNFIYHYLLAFHNLFPFCQLLPCQKNLNLLLFRQFLGLHQVLVYRTQYSLFRFGFLKLISIPMNFIIFRQQHLF